jgi:hypothetical protein
MRKKLLCLAMTLLMVVGSTVTAFAQDYQGSDGWLVDFDGSNMKSNFTSANMNDEMADVQPGDSIELKVEIKNSGSVKTDWYMTNEVIQTLEEASDAANGGAYEYRLTYVNNANVETVLFDSETVGGDNNADSNTGLHQATESLEDYFYLDRLDKGQSGTVHLWVQVEGETQGNGYQRTLAALQMNFAVEKVAEGTTRNVVNRVTGDNVTRTQVRNPVKTGDNTKILLFSAIALASGLVLLGLGFYSLKRRKSTAEKGE